MDSKVRVEKESRRWDFANDLIPGLTTAAVVVPKALAYATIALLPVQAGLFAAIVPMAVYAMLGSSRLLSVSTTTHRNPLRNFDRRGVENEPVT